MTDFYVPRTKAELVNWFKKNRANYKVSKLSKNQLYAIYFRIRKAEKYYAQREMSDAVAYKMLVDVG